MASSAIGRSQRSLAQSNRLGAIWLLILLVGLAGGSSRPDAVQLLLLRPASVLLLGYALWHWSRGDMPSVRAPLTLLLLLAGWIAFQLIPLPPSAWMHLPGRELAVATTKLAGTSGDWYPMSLAPGRSWNTLVSLILPLATLILAGSMSPNERRMIMLPLLVLGGMSLLFGFAQRLGPPDGPLYIYAITNTGTAVGLLANRNHQAVLLAALIPVMAVYVLSAIRITVPMLVSLLIASLIIFVGVTLTQSRIGFLLLILSMAITLALTSGRIARMLTQMTGRFIRRRTLVVASVGIAALAALPIILVRVDIFARLAQITASEFRVNLLPVYWQMITDSFPTGIGFGAFERVFQIVEPFDALRPAYLNHAHNDLAEWVIEGGLVGVLILAGFVLWWVSAAYAALLNGLENNDGTALAGLMVTLILLVASLVDYPLRTPTGMVLMTIGCAWLSAGSGRVHNGLAEAKN